MKRSVALAMLSQAQRNILKDVYINRLYYITLSGTRVLILVTHFYKTGVRYKLLTLPKYFPYRYLSSDLRPKTLDYRNLHLLNIEPADPTVIPLHINEGTQYYVEYLKGTRGPHPKPRLIRIIRRKIKWTQKIKNVLKSIV